MTQRRPLHVTFADLWRTSALIQGILALAYSAAIIFLACTSREIPGILLGILGTIIGFYFGAKTATTST